MIEYHIHHYSCCVRFDEDAYFESFFEKVTLEVTFATELIQEKMLKKMVNAFRSCLRFLSVRLPQHSVR